MSKHVGKSTKTHIVVSKLPEMRTTYAFIKYTEHYTDTFITFKEIMRTVSNIYHNCVPDKIKNRRNTDQLKQRDTVIIACVIWGIINGYTSQRATYRAVCSVLFPNGDFPSRSRFTRLSSNLAYTIKIIRYFSSRSSPKVN